VSLLFSTAPYLPVPVQNQVILYGKDTDQAPIESMREFCTFEEGILYGPQLPPAPRLARLISRQPLPAPRHCAASRRH